MENGGNALSSEILDAYNKSPICKLQLKQHAALDGMLKILDSCVCVSVIRLKETNIKLESSQ